MRGHMRHEREDAILRMYPGLYFHCIALVKVKVFVLFSGTIVSFYLSGTVFIANLVVELK